MKRFIGSVLIGLAFVLSFVGIANAAPPPSTGKAVVTATPVSRFGGITGSDVTALSYFHMGSHLYVVVGGQITGYKDSKGGHPVSRLAVIDGSTGDLVWSAHSINGFVQTVRVVHHTDKPAVIYLGGDFTSVDGHSVYHAAAYNATSPSTNKLSVSFNTSWKPHVDGEIRAITTGDGRIYLGAWSLTAVSETTGAKIWSVWSDCSYLAVLYHSGYIYAGGISRTFVAPVGKSGSVTTHGAIRVNSDTGKIDSGFKPVVQDNPKKCGDPTATAREIDGGANPMSFAWDSSKGNGRLVEGDGGIHNVVRYLSPTSGYQYWYHNTDGDAQTVAVVENQLFVGYHRSGGALTTYKNTNGAMGAILDSQTAVQRVWQPNPDFTGHGDNDSGGNSLDHRSNGIIASMYVDNMLFVGGAFTAGATPVGHTKWIVFPHS